MGTWSHDRPCLEGMIPTSKGSDKQDVLSRSLNLAQLNHKCHMNYSFIFTEINFYPEISNLTQTFENLPLQNHSTEFLDITLK